MAGMQRSGLSGRDVDRSTYVAALFLSAFTAQASVLALSPLLPKIAETLGASVGGVGQLRTISGGVACLTALALGRWPTVRLRSLVAGGVALLALGSLACALAPTLTVLGLAQVPVGVELAAVLVGALTAAGEWPSAERRTRVLAWTLVGQPVAWVVGMPIVGTIAGTAGWRPALMVLPVSASVPALLAMRRAPGGRAPARSRERRWLLRPPVARWALGEVLAFSAWSGTLVYAGTLFADSYGAGPAQVGLVLGAGAAAYLPGNFAARPWVERSARIATGVLAPRRCRRAGAVRRAAVAGDLRRAVRGDGRHRWGEDARRERPGPRARWVPARSSGRVTPPSPRVASGEWEPSGGSSAADGAVGVSA